MASPVRWRTGLSCSPRDFCLPSGDDESASRRVRRSVPSAPLIPARNKHLSRVAESLHAERFPVEGEVASEARLQQCIGDYKVASDHMAKRMQHHMSCLHAQLPHGERARDARVASLIGMHMSRIADEDSEDMLADPHAPCAPGSDRFMEDSDGSDVEIVSENSAGLRSATPEMSASPVSGARGAAKRKFDYDSPIPVARKKVAPLLPRRSMRGSASPLHASPSSSPLAVGEPRSWGGRSRPSSAASFESLPPHPASPNFAWTKALSPGSSGPGYGSGGIGLRISATQPTAPQVGEVMDEGIRTLELG